MKKLLLIIVMFFCCISNIYADDNLVIENLNINNGVISPKFDKYNNYYSVTINEDTDKILFDIDYDNEIYDIEIINNNNLNQNKLIYINIFNRETKEKNTYIFKIFIDNIDINVSQIDSDEISKLEVKNNEEKPKIIAPYVGAICFILIILVYYVMFLR